MQPGGANGGRAFAFVGAIISVGGNIQRRAGVKAVNAGRVPTAGDPIKRPSHVMGGALTERQLIVVPDVDHMSAIEGFRRFIETQVVRAVGRRTALLVNALIAYGVAPGPVGLKLKAVRKALVQANESSLIVRKAAIGDAVGLEGLNIIERGWGDTIQFVQ